MDSFDIALSLLRSSLWGVEAPDLELDEGWWEEIFELANAQGVYALIPDVFRRGCVPPRAILARWMLEVERVESANARVEAVARNLGAVWDAAGIRYAVLKGSSLAGLYPRPEHRVPGDIDYYFPEALGWDTAKRAAGRLGDPAFDSDGDFHYCVRGVVIEHHRGWNHLSSRSARGMKATLDGNALSPEDTLLMLSAHILRHSFIGGVGLRQLADLAVATRRFNGKYDKVSFRRRLEDLKLGKWGGLLSAVMKSSFGLAEHEIPFAPDTRYLDEFLYLVRHDGNFGGEKVFEPKLYLRRLSLFLRVAPGELLSRYLSLSLGRIKRVLGIGTK